MKMKKSHKIPLILSGFNFQVFSSPENPFSWHLSAYEVKTSVIGLTLKDSEGMSKWEVIQIVRKYWKHRYFNSMPAIISQRCQPVFRKFLDFREFFSDASVQKYL